MTHRQITLHAAILASALIFSGCATQQVQTQSNPQVQENERTLQVVREIESTVSQIASKAEQLARLRSESAGETRKPISEMSAWARTGATPSPAPAPKVKVQNFKFVDGPTINVLAKNETAVSMARYIVSKIEGPVWRVEFVGTKELKEKTVRFEGDTPIAALSRIKDITGVKMWINPEDRVVRIGDAE